MAELGSCFGAHLLAQQRQQHLPHAALTPAGKSVVGLFPGRVVLGRRKSLATRGLHMEDGVDHVPGAAHPGTPSFIHFSKVFGLHLPLRVGHVAWIHDDRLP